jgi:DHA2 family multidrug resistance protein-like MFS transporter
VTTQFAPPRAGRREWLALAVLMLPLLLVSMDVSVLYFAVPFIAEDLAPSGTQLLWMFDIYGFVLAGLLLTMGAVGDRIGRRRLLLLGAAGFSAASLLAAYAPNADALIVARALLGVAGATLMPSTLALLRNLFLDERQRATAVAIWTAVTGLGVAVGPVLSGVLLEHFAWGSVFLINLPAMALLLTLGPVLVPEFPVDRSRRIDAAGALLSLAAVLPLVYAVKQLAVSFSDREGWIAPIVGILAGLAFQHRLRTTEHPLIDLGLFGDHGFRNALAGNLVAMFGLVGQAIFTTQYLQSVLGMSPLHAALWSLAPSAVVMASAPLGITLALRVGRAPTVAGAFVLSAVGFLVLTRLGTSGLVVILVGATALAAGLVVVMTVAGETGLRTVDPERAGSASALLESASELGGALGMALLGTVGAAYFRHAVELPDLPGRAGDAARQSLSGALAVAPSLPAALADQVTSAARSAFVQSMHVEATVAAVLMLAAAALTLSRRRG